MGKESRAREQVEKLGKFNVHVRVVFPDDTELEYDCASWTPGANALALDINPAYLILIPNTSMKFFVVTPVAGESSIILQ